MPLSPMGIFQRCANITTGLPPKYQTTILQCPSLVPPTPENIRGTTINGEDVRAVSLFYVGATSATVSCRQPSKSWAAWIKLSHLGKT
eukprot:4887473-Amphidinium_carterae.3